MRHRQSNQETFTPSGWSPWEGTTMHGSVVLTAVLGQPVFRDDEVLTVAAGRRFTTPPKALRQAYGPSSTFYSRRIRICVKTVSTNGTVNACQ